MELERLSNQDHPFGNRVLLPPVMIIELLTITQAHSIWSWVLALKVKFSTSFHHLSYKHRYTLPETLRNLKAISYTVTWTMREISLLKSIIVKRNKMINM